MVIINDILGDTVPISGYGLSSLKYLPLSYFFSKYPNNSSRNLMKTSQAGRYSKWSLLPFDCGIWKEGFLQTEQMCRLNCYGLYYERPYAEASHLICSCTEILQVQFSLPQPPFTEFVWLRWGELQVCLDEHLPWGKVPAELIQLQLKSALLVRLLRIPKLTRFGQLSYTQCNYCLDWVSGGRWKKGSAMGVYAGNINLYNWN